LVNPTEVTGIVTQGRYPNIPRVYQWVTSYKIAYGNLLDELQTIQNNNGTDEVNFNIAKMYFLNLPNYRRDILEEL